MPQTATSLKAVNIQPGQKIKRDAKVPSLLRLVLANTDDIPLELEIINTAQKHLQLSAIPDTFRQVPGSDNKWTGIVTVQADSTEAIIDGFTFHNTNTQPNGGVALIKVSILNKKYDISRMTHQSFE